jgi:hypothetical protein
MSSCQPIKPQHNCYGAGNDVHIACQHLDFSTFSVLGSITGGHREFFDKNLT